MIHLSLYLSRSNHYHILAPNFWDSSNDGNDGNFELSDHYSHALRVMLYALKASLEAFLGSNEIPKAVISVPTKFSAELSDYMKQISEDAGFDTFVPLVLDL
jgi:molecular chaperone DnaK (HSP70)